MLWRILESDEMVQAKISSFFKGHGGPPPLKSMKSEQSEVFITYHRRHPNPNSNSGANAFLCDNNEIESGNETSANIEKMHVDSTITSPESGSLAKILNKKRSYRQFHLELGQSDFLLHTCSVCGFVYARGEEGDEKVHKAFHKDFYQGIRFKGWSKERIVFTYKNSGDRIVLVLNVNSLKQKQKVEQVVKIMEKELGFDNAKLLHNLCQVYLFISNHRIVGCLLAERIKTAHRVISNSSHSENSDSTCETRNFASHKAGMIITDTKRQCSPSLHFGNIKFQRETVRKDSTNRLSMNQLDNGAILCEEEAVPAQCGIRAIWVVPYKRRSRVASKLLDAARKYFCAGQELEPSQCAFSSPTSAGKAFASSYSGSKCFLIYKTQNV